MALDVERVMDGAGLAASALPIAPARADEAVELVLWSWLPDFQAPVDLFQAAHPSIKVKLVNAGQVRSFRQLNALADVGEWANPHKGEFAEWCWNQVSDGGKVYSMPWDSGPIVVLYRKDIFEKYNIAVPQTWDEFAEQARFLHPLRRADGHRRSYLGVHLRPSVRPLLAALQMDRAAAAGFFVRPDDALLPRQHRHLGIHRLQHDHLLRGAEGDPFGAPRSRGDRRSQPPTICVIRAAAAHLAGDPPHHHLFHQWHAPALQRAVSHVRRRSADH